MHRRRPCDPRCVSRRKGKYENVSIRWYIDRLKHADLFSQGWQPQTTKARSPGRPLLFFALGANPTGLCRESGQSPSGVPYLFFASLPQATPLCGLPTVRYVCNRSRVGKNHQSADMGGNARERCNENGQLVVLKTFRPRKG